MATAGGGTVEPEAPGGSGKAVWRLPLSGSAAASPGKGIHPEDEDEELPFNWTLAVAVFIAASSGLLFGYDLGVIGALPGLPGFAEFHSGGEPLSSSPAPAPADGPGDSAGGALCAGIRSDEPPLGVYLTISMFAAGMVGGGLGSYASAEWGRRPTLVAAGALYTAGTCLEGMAPAMGVFYVGRILVGMGIGLANQVAPVYLAEIAPAAHRGAINISFQFFITFGILLSTVVSFLLIDSGTARPGIGNGEGWRWHLVVGAIPGLFVMFGAVALTETPQYLMGSAKPDAGALAYYILSELRQRQPVDREYERMTLYCDCRHSWRDTWKNLFLDRRRIPPITVTVALVVFQQITFLNGFLFFLPSLFGAGIATDDLRSDLYASLTNSIINFFATTIAIFTADKFGRRPLFFAAGAVMGFASVVMAILISYITDTSEIDQRLAFVIVAVVELFVAGYAWSWGPLPWAMPAELNAWPWRTAGTSFAVIVNFAVSIVTAAVFPYLLCTLGFGLFILILLVLVAGTSAAYLLFPEPAHCDLNETEFLFKGHWYWTRFYPEQERIDLVMPLRAPFRGCWGLCTCGGCTRDDASGGDSYFPAECPATSGPIDVGSGAVHPTLTDLYGVPSSVRPSLRQTDSGTLTGSIHSFTTGTPPGSVSKRPSLTRPVPVLTTTLGRGITAAMEAMEAARAQQANEQQANEQQRLSPEPRRQSQHSLPGVKEA